VHQHPAQDHAKPSRFQLVFPQTPPIIQGPPASHPESLSNLAVYIYIYSASDPPVPRLAASPRQHSLPPCTSAACFHAAEGSQKKRRRRRALGASQGTQRWLHRFDPPVASSWCFGFFFPLSPFFEQWYWIAYFFLVFLN
jgi:hypothetical protein